MFRNDAGRGITQGVIWKQLLTFFFPILLGSFFQQMYNTVDTIIVGRAVGTQALAAVGSTSPLINLINGFFIGLSTGSTVILSQYYGANDREGTERALHTGVALSLILGLLTAAIGVSFGPRFLALIRTPENCREDAALYVRDADAPATLLPLAMKTVADEARLQALSQHILQLGLPDSADVIAREVMKLRK